MKLSKLINIAVALLASSHVLADSTTSPTTTLNANRLGLQRQTGFFRATFENLQMPNDIPSMGLLGVNYYADVTPNIYAGFGGYGAVTGTQGGLFVLNFGGGLHKEFIPHWWGDIGLDVGGGGGRSSLVGGGLMLRSHVGIEYSWSWARLGLHYSYIDFPSGQIRSQQLGLDFDIPCEFYYVPAGMRSNTLFNYDDLFLSTGKFLSFQRNDFALILQAYRQRTGTLNVNGDVQDGTIGLVGAELDHYITNNTFWWLKTSGAYTGIPNGYMDVLGGFGYHWALGSSGLALVPQFGVGAGGGGNVDTGGGVLIQPQVGIEWPLTKNFAARVNGGYLWAPDGNLSAVTGTAAIIYHLDVATGVSSKSLVNSTNLYAIQNWRIQMLNQTYFHPQRSSSDVTSAINMLALQIDQFFTPNIFLTYQASGAYDGDHSGGLATGMIGPGLQSPSFMNQHASLFAEFLIGAAGGGSLAVSGGAVYEPVIGVNYNFTPVFGLQASYSQLRAFSDDLNTPVFNIGFTVNFGSLQPA